MGRVGIEPTTLGLRVDDGAVVAIRKAWRSRIVRPNVLGRVGASSRRLVDFALTPSARPWGDLTAVAASRKHPETVLSRDPLLTMKLSPQPVPTHGNGFGLFQPFSGSGAFATVATGCARWATSTLHHTGRNGLKKGGAPPSS